VPRLTN